MNLEDINIINLTPHPVTIIGEQVIPPSGENLRVPRKVKDIEGSLKSVYDDIRHIEMPPIVPKTIYIVSGQTASALHKLVNRPDIFFPINLVKDSTGKVIGCENLGTFSQPSVVRNFLSIPIVKVENIINSTEIFYLVEEFFNIKHTKQYTKFGYFIEDKSQILNLHSSAKNITALKPVPNNIDIINRLYDKNRLGIILLNNQFKPVEMLSKRGSNIVTDNSTFKVLLPVTRDMQKTISVYLQKLQTRYFSYALAEN